MAIAEPPPRTRMSAAEFRNLPEGPPYYEYERGEVIPMPRPHPRHSDVAGVLFGALRSHIRQNQLGKLFMDSLVEVLPDLLYAPDLFFVAKGGKATYDPTTGEVSGAPELVVEVLSPLSGAARDRVRKFEVYREAGVDWYWIIDPVELSIEEYHLVDGSYVRTASLEAGSLFRPGLFAGLEIDLRALVGEEAPAAPAAQGEAPQAGEGAQA